MFLYLLICTLTMVDEIVQHFLEQYSTKCLDLGCTVEATCYENEQGRTLRVVIGSKQALSAEVKERIENNLLPWIYDWQEQKYAVKVFYKI